MAVEGIEVVVAAVGEDTGVAEKVEEDTDPVAAEQADTHPVVG